MLILVLIIAQYLQNVVFSFEKGLSGQNHSSSDSHHQLEKFSHANFPSPTPLRYLEKPRQRTKFVKIHFACSKLNSTFLLKILFSE